VGFVGLSCAEPTLVKFGRANYARLVGWFGLLWKVRDISSQAGFICLGLARLSYVVSAICVVKLVQVMLNVPTR
jgi:hypothetical protein